MKRLVPIAAVLVLVPASAASAWRGEKSIVAARKHAATLSARSLLREFVPPPGVHRIHGRPHDYRQTQSMGLVGETVDLHGFWVGHESLSAIAAFEKAHVPDGFSVGGGGTNGAGPQTELVFDSPRHGVATRLLAISISQLRTRTIVRADAEVVWVYPRSPQEVVPAGVREIDVTAPKLVRRITAPQQIGKVARWFDRLPISPPGISLPCPLVPATQVALVFRSANGAPVARAQVPAPHAGICDEIDFQIQGKQQAPLIDQLWGKSFAWRLEHLLGVRFSRPPY